MAASATARIRVSKLFVFVEPTLNCIFHMEICILGIHGIVVDIFAIIAILAVAHLATAGPGRGVAGQCRVPFLKKIYALKKFR
uniref:Uncharacterized protein n=2 Tax=Romanomermis culicivorax TaxID=13658 RepID=A0A915J5F3_ROMCU